MNAGRKANFFCVLGADGESCTVLNNEKYLCQHGLRSLARSLVIVSLEAILTIFQTVETLCFLIVLPFHMLMCRPVELDF